MSSFLSGFIPILDNLIGDSNPLGDLFAYFDTGVDEKDADVFAYFDTGIPIATAVLFLFFGETT